MGKGHQLERSKRRQLRRIITIHYVHTGSKKCICFHLFKRGERPLRGIYVSFGS